MINQGFRVFSISHVKRRLTSARDLHIFQILLSRIHYYLNVLAFFGEEKRAKSAVSPKTLNSLAPCTWSRSTSLYKLGTRGRCTLEEMINFVKPLEF